jgi:hypothetical protein
MFVSGPFGRGRVDMVVTGGKVPGVDGDVEGSKDSPAARVVVWKQDGGTWKATSRKVGVKIGPLKRIAPLTFGRKDLIGLLAEHEQITDDMGGVPLVTGRQVKTVYDRGLRDYPGHGITSLDPDGWATGRVGVFLQAARGERDDSRDADLLGDGAT